MELETGGNCKARGATGEKGCYQFMPGTWRAWSQRVIGYVAEQTPTNEHYVALHKIQTHLNAGASDADIFLIWNQGNSGLCRKGVNAAGVHYDSCAYQKKALQLLASL